MIAVWANSVFSPIRFFLTNFTISTKMDGLVRELKLSQFFTISHIIYNLNMSESSLSPFYLIFLFIISHQISHTKHTLSEQDHNIEGIHTKKHDRSLQANRKNFRRKITSRNCDVNIAEFTQQQEKKKVQ